MNQRYIAAQDGEHGWFGVWDNRGEEWTHVPTVSATEHEAEEQAKHLNENECAFCGEQCGEAHSNTRYGRICESCSDERLDENGEIRIDGELVPVDADRDFVAKFEVVFEATNLADAMHYAQSLEVTEPGGGKLDRRVTEVVEEIREQSLDAATLTVCDAAEAVLLFDTVMLPEQSAAIRAAIKLLREHATPVR